MLNVTTNFTKNYCTRKKITCLEILCLAVAASGSCSRVDLELGGNLVPDNQVMYTELDSSIMVKTYILSGDTLATNRCGALYWGAKVDDCGEMVAEFASQFYTNEVTDYSFNGDIWIDSLTMTVAVKSTLGNCSDKQQLSVYALNDQLNYDTVYYSDFEIGQLKHNLLTSLNVSVNPDVYTYKLYDAQTDKNKDIENWVGKLVNSAVYESEESFHTAFPGLYFAQPNNSNGAVCEIDADSSYMTLYYKRGANVSDSSRKVNYYFTQDSINTGVSRISFNYSQTLFAHQIDSMFEAGSEYCPVQTLGGLKSLFVIEHRQLESLKNKIIARGYRNVAINRAVLTFSTIMPSDSAFNQALLQIGLFKKFRSYTSEYDSVRYGDSLKTMSLDRTYGTYSVDITSELVSGLSRQQQDLKIILASLPSNLYGLQQVILAGSGAAKNMPKLKLMFTAIGKDNQPKE